MVYQGIRRSVCALAAGMIVGALALQAPAARAAGQKPSMAHEELTTITATVVAINLQERAVTLRGPGGNTAVVWVDPSVKNLNALKVGDHVTVEYYQSLVIQARKAAPGEKLSAHGMETSWVADAHGQPSARTTAHEVEVTARVMALDKPNGIITLKGPKGNIRTFHLADPSVLKNVTVGDLIVVTYQVARAVSVTKV